VKGRDFEVRGNQLYTRRRLEKCEVKRSEWKLKYGGNREFSRRRVGM
jgi:hypothetical protein